MFHVKNLHSGHLAKAFALREAPSNMTHRALQKNDYKSVQKRTKPGRRRGAEQGSDEEDQDVSRTERRMKDVVRSQGRLTKKGGVLMSVGASEFQVISGDALAKLIPTSGSGKELIE
jgi:ATP-dependent RNA helicase DDX31/DBP7